MVDLGCPKLIRRVLPIVSSANSRRTLTLEPWADEFPLEPNEQLVVVLVGPETGEPSIELGDDWISVYGWPESEAFVFQSDRRIGVFSTDLGQIIRRELEIGECHRRTESPPDTALASLAEIAQWKISSADFGSESAGSFAAYWGSQIAELLYKSLLVPSESAAALVWNIGTKILNVAGFTLPKPVVTRLCQFLEETPFEKKLPKVFERLAVPIDPNVPLHPGSNFKLGHESRGRSQRK
jgi:hypothetical protein